ncbi:DUF3616 domain-containing protein [Leptolyngbya sp. FACHB-321]|uniref:DUF3616 domain-containing protein n=1 Tax=Leptolyngbya sp. FACHB-321 TaxID=2692807 RepID=UPI0016855D56|nr:DUF3616 domain-containing protein [Leptolyngbya sp. FACHB-321]MBD2034149.1 DUF3616 domain-containing protein [Leptolyngbya sp. FACHB-321]
MMTSTSGVLLEFDSQLNQLSKGKKLHDGLSVVVQIGPTLWVANDETVSVERLSRQEGTDGTDKYGEHKQFALHDYLQLPVPPSDSKDGKKIEEADIEGLDYNNGYLWLVGSHSLKRSKPDPEDSSAKSIKRLAKVSRDGNRFLLARIPVAEETYTLEKVVEQNGKQLTAAQLHGTQTGNALTTALAEDEHLQSFLAIPGKDNGFDIEGLAVLGSRIFLGLRGPVLRGWAVILELEVEEESPSSLKLRPIGTGGRPYRKHFLDLNGLGIRALCVQEADLLILAGPTMNLDGPVMLFRWSGGTQPSGESLVDGDALDTIMNIPFGQGQEQRQDHAEGMTLFGPNGSDTRSILVVYDSASASRQVGTSGVKADVFALI